MRDGSCLTSFWSKMIHSEFKNGISPEAFVRRSFSHGVLDILLLNGDCSLNNTMARVLPETLGRVMR